MSTNEMPLLEWILSMDWVYWKGFPQYTYLCHLFCGSDALVSTLNYDLAKRERYCEPRTYDKFSPNDKITLYERKIAVLTKLSPCIQKQ